MDQQKGQSHQKPAEAGLLFAVNYAYERAKCWSALLLFIQGFLFLGATVAIFFPNVTLSYLWIAFPLTIINTFAAAQAAKYKGLADEAKRKHEYLEGFGIQPDGRWLADFRVDYPGKLPDELQVLLREGMSYSSRKEIGPERVLENLVESAWFSRHLAGWCAHRIAALIVISLVVAITGLLLLATSLSGAVAGVIAARSIAATLLFLISLGVTRSYSSFSSFSKKAGNVADVATDLLEGRKEINRFDAQRLLAGYVRNSRGFSRAGSSSYAPRRNIIATRPRGLVQGLKRLAPARK